MGSDKLAMPHALTSKAITAEYARRGDGLGWSFLTCPAANLREAKVAIVTTNPGGKVPEAPRWSCEEGSSYEVEQWLKCAPGQQKLQIEVQRMCALIPVPPGQALSGHLVPFRSPSLALLAQREEAFRYGATLWREVFSYASQVRLVVAFGFAVAENVASVLGAAPGASYPAGWGKLQIITWTARDGRRVVGLPHLSRFGIFSSKGRSIAEASFKAAIA